MRLPIPVMALAALTWSAGPALAQTYPTKPITMVVPFSAGGGSDLVARTFADHMKGSLGHPVLIENILGASGSIGTARVARSPADGYTLSFGQWASHVGASAAYPVKYDVLNDFDPVARLSDSPLWIVTRNDLPARDFRELIAWLKANPAKASAATVGAGSGAHLCGIDLQNNTGTQFQFVPYRGGAPAMQDMVAGQIDFMCDNASNSLPLVRSGRVKALAVMAKDRWFAAPDVPTVDEMGAPGLHISFWHGIWTPRGTPKGTIDTLNAAVVQAFADPSVRARLAEQGQQIPPRDQQTPEALAAFHKAETEKWWPLIKGANIKGE